MVHAIFLHVGMGFIIECDLMQTTTELKTQVLTRAAEDSDFRARLIADPKAAISSEMGMDVPDGLDRVVHEDNATTTHLVLPPSPKVDR